MPARSSTRITKSVVDRLHPGQTVWDAEVKGFGVRCQASSKTYVLKTVHRREQKWLTIGKHGSPWTADSARREALRLLGIVQTGLDPKAAQPDRSGRLRMRELCERYLHDHAVPFKKPLSVRSDRKNIENHVIPLLGKLYVEDLTRADVEKFQLDVRDGVTAKGRPTIGHKGGSVVTGGPGVSNRCIALLSKMLNLAEAWDIRSQNSNPTYGLKKFRENCKERFLSATELDALSNVLIEAAENETESPHVIAAIRLLLLTGARLNEILTLQWGFIDFERFVARLPDSKTGARNLMLNTAAIEVLRALSRQVGNPYVILGKANGRHLVNLQKPWQRIRKAAGLDGVRIHDLRHTHISIGIANGDSLATMGKLAGHRNARTTERYAHLAEDHLRAASERVGRRLKTAT